MDWTASAAAVIVPHSYGYTCVYIHKFISIYVYMNIYIYIPSLQKYHSPSTLNSRIKYRFSKGHTHTHAFLPFRTHHFNVCPRILLSDFWVDKSLALLLPSYQMLTPYFVCKPGHNEQSASLANVLCISEYLPKVGSDNTKRYCLCHHYKVGYK